jgi:hypothetical protein
VTIRVLLADDQALIRAGFKMIIDAGPDLEAADGREAVRQRSFRVASGRSGLGGHGCRNSTR